MPGFSQRVGRVSLAASVQMTIKARELKAAGKPVVTLTTGEPNFDSPPHAIEAAHQAALAGDTKYPPQDGVDVQIEAYQRRRDLAVRMLNDSKGISCHRPEGAFYVFPNVAGCLGKTTAGGRVLRNDEDVCLALLEEQYVATVHGAAYHMSPFLRISTATADDELLEGLSRIQTFCEGLH